MLAAADLAALAFRACRRCPLRLRARFTSSRLLSAVAFSVRSWAFNDFLMRAGRAFSRYADGIQRARHGRTINRPLEIGGQADFLAPFINFAK